MVGTQNVQGFLSELQRAHEELVAELSRVREADIEVAPAPGEWSVLETAWHIPYADRFWIIWIQRVRGALRAFNLIRLAPQTKTPLAFTHPSLDGVKSEKLREALEELKQVINELVELLGWTTPEEYVTVVPPFTPEERARLISHTTPNGAYYDVSLPIPEQRDRLNQMLTYAGGFSIRGMCGHILEGHTRNHINQIMNTRKAVEAARK